MQPKSSILQGAGKQAKQKPLIRAACTEVVVDICGVLVPTGLMPSSSTVLVYLVSLVLPAQCRSSRVLAVPWKQRFVFTTSHQHVM